jgi:single-stranded-DNA-specific exonuclease
MKCARVFAPATEFLAGLGPGRVAVVMDGDADGLSGGRLVAYTLAERGLEVVPVFPGKGEHGYAAHVVEEVLRAEVSAVVLVDTGAAAENPYRPRPVLVLDHHRPLGIPEEATFVSSFGREPTETSSLITYLACLPLVDLEPVAWLVLIGVFGDLGRADAFEYLAPLVKQYTKTQVRKAVTLLNAAGRSSRCDVATAYEALCEAKSPRDVAARQSSSARKLESYRKEVQVALEEAARIAPEFADGLALVRIHSACLIHGLIASRWANRLKRYPVVVVNTGYLPGQAVFSLRATGGIDLIALLRERLGPGENLGGTVGYGHRTATGGQIPLERVADLLRALGFSEASGAATGP